MTRLLQARCKVGYEITLANTSVGCEIFSSASTLTLLTLTLLTLTIELMLFLFSNDFFVFEVIANELDSPHNKSSKSTARESSCICCGKKPRLERTTVLVTGCLELSMPNNQPFEFVASYVAS